MAKTKEELKTLNSKLKHYKPMPIGLLPLYF